MEQEELIVLSDITPPIYVSPFTVFNIFSFPTQDIQYLSAEDDQKFDCFLLTMLLSRNEG